MNHLILIIELIIERLINIIFFSNFAIFFPILLLIFLLFISFFISNKKFNFFKNFSFILLFFIFIFYCLIFIFNSKNLQSGYFFLYEINYLKIYNLNLIFGIDNITIFFLILTSFLAPLCVLINWNYNFFNFKLFILILSILNIFLLITFMSLNLLFFYFFFESTLIPMFFIIGFWGSRNRKIHAVYMFFFYTVLGSIFLLSGILILYSMFYSFDIRHIYFYKIDSERQIILWLLFFIGFAIKIPIPPFHIWLPEAHVEAPTSGSVLLAGILLKLGSYGMLRFIIPLYDYANLFFSPFVYFLCILTIIYISSIACRQIDLKKIIAYSSIAHMSFIVIGLFSYTIEGIVGSIFLMISHGLISSALFACVGMLYERYNTRLIIYFNNVCQTMPIFSIFFMFFVLSNIGFPLTSGFIGEFLICLSAINCNIFLGLVCVFSIIFTSIYCIIMFNKVIFSRNNFFDVKNFLYRDLNKQEFYLLFIILFFIILLGIFPNIIIDKLMLISEIYILKNLNE